MKALSLTQPWATLIAIGVKRIETRSWSTSYLGIVAIHAAKGFPRSCRDLCGQEPFYSVLQAYGKQYSQVPRSLKGYVDDPVIPLGMIIAVARLRQVTRTDDLDWSFARDVYGVEPDREQAFGDYSEGRFAWAFGDLCKLPIPIPCKGALGLWTVPAGIYEAIAPQLLLVERQQSE